MASGFSEHYLWTQHARVKMRQYGLTESRIKRVIRYPVRVEEGILEGAIACMQRVGGNAVGAARPARAGLPGGGKRYSEIWTMYTLVGERANPKQRKIKVITAWRYPGKSPARDPVPAEILREIKNLL